jgi:hypothetical protein
MVPIVTTNDTIATRRLNAQGCPGLLAKTREKRPLGHSTCSSLRWGLKPAVSACWRNFLVSRAWRMAGLWEGLYGEARQFHHCLQPLAMAYTPSRPNISVEVRSWPVPGDPNPYGCTLFSSKPSKNEVTDYEWLGRECMRHEPGEKAPRNSKNRGHGPRWQKFWGKAKFIKARRTHPQSAHTGHEKCVKISGR